MTDIATGTQSCHKPSSIDAHEGAVSGSSRKKEKMIADSKEVHSTMSSKILLSLQVKFQI